MTQDDIIEQFIAKYNTCQSNTYKVTRWPDKENRTSRNCDAYAEVSEGSPLAIEHTSIQTFDDQMLDAARFMKVIGELEVELKDAFDCQTRLIVPTFAISPGTNWQTIRTALRVWLLAHVPTLPSGETKHRVDGLPFTVTINVDRDGRLRPWFGVMRWTPPGLDNYSQLTESIAAALTDKDSQLRKYSEAGIETVLILESRDIALVNPAILYKAFLKARDKVSPANIDQVWVANTYQADCRFDCFQASEVIMDEANRENFMFGPRYSDYWRKAIAQDDIKASS